MVAPSATTEATTPYFSLLTSHFLLLTSYFLLPQLLRRQLRQLRGDRGGGGERLPLNVFLLLTSYSLLLTSYVLLLTSYLLPLTSYFLPLTSHRLPLTSHLSPLTSYFLQERLQLKVYEKQQADMEKLETFVRVNKANGVAASAKSKKKVSKK